MKRTLLAAIVAAATLFLAACGSTSCWQNIGRDHPTQC